MNNLYKETEALYKQILDDKDMELKEKVTLLSELCYILNNIKSLNTAEGK